jgi:nuclear transcription factor Y gamma
MESVNSNNGIPATSQAVVAAVAVAAGAKRPPEEVEVNPTAVASASTDTQTVQPPPAKKPAAATPSTTTQQLQQQIQQQLQQQLQAQLQAAAARGQQANITPEQIQAQAQAMVQAAAQAQAVVAAAKSRGDGLVPMNAGQIAALSQIQAQAIVHARTKSQGSAQQIQTQIQLQCQALVHAHTQAQIQAGIYKGDGNSGNKNAAGAKVGNATAATAAATARAAPVIAQSAAKKAIATKSMLVLSALTPQQLQQQEDLKKHQAAERAKKVGPAATPAELAVLDQQYEKQMADLHTAFRKQNAAAVYAGVAPQTVLPNPVLAGSNSNLNNRMVTTSSSDLHGGMHTVSSSNDVLMAGVPQPSSNSPQFLQQLNTSLNQFWQDSLDQIQRLQDQTEQDFKNHNDLPLARIKRIMKSDEDVRMISAEAPVLFAKACELFILDLSIRSWNYSQLHKRRTLQKEDVREAIQKTDIFDFLVDVIQ